jgi:hypothetical protein
MFRSCRPASLPQRKKCMCGTSPRMTQRLLPTEPALASAETRRYSSPDRETTHDVSRAAREKSKCGPRGRMVEHSSGSCRRRSNDAVPMGDARLSAFQRLDLGRSRLVGARVRSPPDRVLAGLGRADTRSWSRGLDCCNCSGCCRHCDRHRVVLRPARTLALSNQCSRNVAGCQHRRVFAYDVDSVRTQSPDRQCRIRRLKPLQPWGGIAQRCRYAGSVFDHVCKESKAPATDTRDPWGNIAERS